MTDDVLAQYDAAVGYLDSLLKWHQAAPAAYDRDIHRTRERMLLRHWGDPHLCYPVAHVAGTSGKGSTSTMLAAILQAAGYHTGLHTSPYLQAYTEKIRIGEHYLPIPDFTALVAELHGHVGAMLDGIHGPPSYFEATVGLALAAFARAGVNAAVVEVGVGGRHDATNVVQPAVTAITNVGFDHMQILGHTLRDIAFQKAGIIKPGVPAVTAATDPDAYAVIRYECAAWGVPLTTVRVDTPPADPATTMHAEVHDLDADGARFTLRHGDWVLPDVHIGMLGTHQVTNAATAAAAARALDANGVPVGDEAIRAGLARAFFPGRLEVMQRGGDKPTVVIDGAHNPDKARSLVAALHALFPGKRVVLVLGVVADKDASSVLDILLPVASAAVTTQAPIINRTVASADDLAALVRARGVPCDAVPDPDDAIAAALGMAGAGDLVCVTGSLYLVGAVRRHWIATDTVAVRATSLP